MRSDAAGSDFAGKVILITGGAKGQGAATARALTQRGAQVVVADVDEAAAHSLCSSLPLARAVSLDAASRGSWESVVDGLSRLDGLVNNAGVFAAADIGDLDDEVSDRMYRVNQLGIILGLSSCEYLLSRSSGVVVNIASTAGVRGISGRVAYTGTKWAVRGISRAAAVEWAPRGIRVNCVIPGLIDTPMARINSEDALAAISQTIPMQRMGSADEVAQATVFLLSDAASYITGAELLVAGGDGA